MRKCREEWKAATQSQLGEVSIGVAVLSVSF